MEKQVYLAAKRVTNKWEKAQRECASMGFIGSEGKFVSWKGTPLTNPGWAVERPFLRKNPRFLEMVGEITWPVYQANKRVGYAYESTQKALSENRMLRRRLKNQEESTYTPQRKMTGGWTEESEKTSEGVLYVAENMLAYNVYKVGKTNLGRQGERLGELQTSTPMRFVYEIESKNVIELETKVQELLEQYNLRQESSLEPYVGRELFRCSLQTIMNAIKECTK